MSGGSFGGGSELTAQAGAEVLALGGNATDAAVAAALASFHAEPLLASAAGGGMMLAGSVNRGFSALDFVPTMPGLGVLERPRLDFASVDIDFGVTSQTFHVGRGAAAVPAGLVGLAEAHRMWGSLPLRAVGAPAVRKCREGVVLNATSAGIVAMLEPIWSMSPEAARLYTLGGRRADVGDRLVNPDFADVLERLASDGTGPFYTGEIAHRTIAAFGPPAGGLLSAEDLVAYSPAVLPPLEVAMWGGVLLAPPPPSTGGTLIALCLALLHRSGLAPSEFQSARHLEALVDAQLLTLALRAEELGKGAFDAAHAHALLSQSSIDVHMQRFGRIQPGPGLSRRGHGSTTHVSVMDDRGGAAAITVSNGEGCGHVIPGTGMHMNNFLGEEDINPKGFHAETPGVRLTSMMAPTIFVKEGRPMLVLGSGGSNRLRTAITQAVLNRVGLEQSVETAVCASRLHAERGDLYAELQGLDREVLQNIGSRFPRYHPFPGRSLYFGGVHAVAREPSGALVGIGDPRRGGAAMTVQER
jgi:gamma-glutamyltranspeptidase/glutathione hydrolase